MGCDYDGDDDVTDHNYDHGRDHDHEKALKDF